MINSNILSAEQMHQKYQQLGPNFKYPYFYQNSQGFGNRNSLCCSDCNNCGFSFTWYHSLIVLSLTLIIAFSVGFSQVNAVEFLWGFFLSFVRVIFAYVIALVVAVITALLVTKKKAIEDLALPILDVLQSFPSFALLPLFLALIGKSVAIVIFLLFITMIWPIMFSLLGGIKALNSEVLDAATVFGAQGFKRFEYVTLPLIFPALITGSIVAWGEAWEAIIATEIIVKLPGVGTYLAEAGETNHSQILIIGILLLMLILFVLNKLFWIPLLNSSTKYQS